MLWMFLLGFVIGSLVGTVLMACCAINRKENNMYVED